MFESNEQGQDLPVGLEKAEGNTYEIQLYGLDMAQFNKIPAGTRMADNRGVAVFVKGRHDNLLLASMRDERISVGFYDGLPKEIPEASKGGKVVGFSSTWKAAMRREPDLPQE